MIDRRRVWKIAAKGAAGASVSLPTPAASVWSAWEMRPGGEAGT